MKVKLNGQKIIASVVVAAMSIAFIPKITGSDTVLAATTKSAANTCLCTSAIQKPVQPTSIDDAWSGSYVYFGTYGGDAIKFRVLAPSTSVYGGSTLFLDSDVILFKDCFDKTPDSEGNYSKSWADSDIRGVLNGTFLTGFTSSEQGAILLSKGDGGLTYTVGSFEEYLLLPPVNVEDRVFLLDASEVLNKAYGYSDDYGYVDEDNDGDWSTGYLAPHEVANREKSSSYSSGWMLRSAEANFNFIDGVCSDGSSGYVELNRESGVAPALNVDRNSIIFSTAVEGTYGQVGASYKLTIFDDSLSITAGEASVSGTKVSIGNTVSGGPSQISVLILDREYTDGNTNDATIKYYGALSEEQSFDFSSTGLDLSGWGRDYYVYILAEKINGDFETDYSTKPVAVAAPASVIATTTYSVNVTISTFDKDGNPTTTAGGTATVSKDSGLKGDKITVTATPNEGYELKSILWGDGGASKDITTAKEFTIENFDVIVDVEFKESDTSSSGGLTTTDPATGTSSGSTTTEPATGTTSGSTTDSATSTSSGTSGSTMDPSAPTYTVIKGADATADGTTDIVIEVKRSEDDEHCLDYFDWVAIDGTKLTSEQAPTSKGSTIVTIKSDYLKTLSEGKHTIVVNFVDNSVSTTITIQAAAQKSGSNIPATGELQSPAIYLGIALIVAACGLTSIVVMKKRKEET